MRIAYGMLLAALLVVTVTGCGGSPPNINPPVKVTGKVTSGGQPVASGVVQVTPTENGRDQAVPFKNGAFEVELMPGKYKATVSGAGVPAKYTKPETTDIAFEVTSSTSEVKIEMKN